jgi:hypothetical protein
VLGSCVVGQPQHHEHQREADEQDGALHRSQASAVTGNV